MNNAKVAVIGAGYWGKNLVRNFNEIGVLSAICDNNQEMLDGLRKKYKTVKCYTDWKDVLGNEDIDALVVATPAASHYEIARSALLANKDIFVEKPLALKLKEVEELIELAEEKKQILMVDHILQYHPAIIKLKELIDTGTLGKLQYIYSHRLNIGRLRREENILWSFAPHDISVILWLVDEQPQRVRAFGEAYLQLSVYDTTITDLTFKDRLKAHIFVSWLHPFKEQKLVVIGDENMAVFDDLEEENKLALYPHRVEWRHREPIASKAKAQFVRIEKKEPLREACLHFLDCIKSRTRPKTDGYEASAVLRVLQQAQDDLDQERRNEK